MYSAVIDFFGSNNLVNNSEKAAILYNSRGRGDLITIDNIEGNSVQSTHSEKLLGLHINSDFEWSTHIDKISIKLKKRIGLLRRIRNRVPKDKIVMIAEAIFNSTIRYGIAVYLIPIFDEEDLKMRKLQKNTTILQTLQNSMNRIVLGLKKQDHINLSVVRAKIKMFSVNQMALYHTLLEGHNILRNSASEQIQLKWTHIYGKNYPLRNITENYLKVPERPKMNCIGFSYTHAKLFNMLPKTLREITDKKTFKSAIKTWIWEKIPSY